MAFQVQLPHLPAGIALTAARPGETVLVQPEGFVSTEDGDALYRFLDDVKTQYLAKIPEPNRPRESTISEMLAIIKIDGSCQLHINDFGLIGQVQTREAVEAGAPVLKHQVADVIRVEPDGITVPDDAGVLFVFSVGWRKAVYYDYRPLLLERSIPRDLGAKVGPLWGYLVFQERIKLDDVTWSTLAAAGWFPFIGLSDSTIKKMVSHVQAGWNLDDVIESAARDARSSFRNFEGFFPITVYLPITWRQCRQGSGTMKRKISLVRPRCCFLESKGFCLVRRMCGRPWVQEAAPACGRGPSARH
jgi:hypothetical protein